MTYSKVKIKAWHIALAYCILTSLFRCILTYTNPMMKLLVLSLSAAMLAVSIKPIFRSIAKRDIKGVVAKLVLLFLFAVVWGWLLYSESFYYSFTSMANGLSGVLPLVLFFVLDRYHVDRKTIRNAFLLLTIIYACAYLISIFTYPQSFFGYAGPDVDAASTVESRGVMRVYVPGNDFCIISFFYILTTFRKKRVYYLLLIPLFLLVLLRGTRTPFFVMSLIAVVYYLSTIKNRALVLILILIAASGLGVAYNAILKSTSDNPIVKYVQLTTADVESNKEDKNIRLEMAEYMFTEHNGGNVLKTLLGNGEYGQGTNTRRRTSYGINHGYYIEDSAITYVFIKYGLVGLLLYILLFYKIYRAKVSGEDRYAKLSMIYYYLITPTNSALIISAPFMVAMCLYVIYKSNIQMCTNDTRYITHV